MHCLKCNTQYHILSAFFDCQKCQQFGIAGYTGSMDGINIDSKKYKTSGLHKLMRLLAALSDVDDNVRKNICAFGRNELALFVCDIHRSFFK